MDSTPVPTKATHLTRKEMYRRGWTAKLFQSFAPEPSHTVPNPTRWVRHPMILYPLAEVERVEATPEFVAARAAAERLGVSARKGHATRDRDERRRKSRR